MAPPKSSSLDGNFSMVVERGVEVGVGARAGVDQRLRRLPSTTGSRSRNMTTVAVRVPRPHREGGDDGDDRAGAGAVVVPFSSPEEGFRGYTFEVREAIKDLRQQLQEREVKGGLMGPLRAVAELQRAQDQQNQAFRMWLSAVMKRERELAKKAEFTLLKRRDQMLQEVGPDWFQQLSWDQMQTVNQLQAVHRADAEEGATARVARWCSLLGVMPVPNERQLTRAIREQPEDHEAFLLALYAVISKSGKPPTPGDPPAPKLRTGFEYTPSERLLLSALAHLRLPNIIAKLEEEFGPPEMRPRYLRINPEVPALPSRSERYLWPYLEPLPVPQVNWLEVHSANHSAHVENLYMRAHKLPPTLIDELLPKPVPRVTIPKASMPTIRRRKRKEPNALASEDVPSGVPPAGQNPAAAADEAKPSRSTGRTVSRSASRTTRSVASSPMRAPAGGGARSKQRSADTAADDPAAPGVDPASVVSFLESLASEDPLCQLPDVHKIPAIHKWVRLRNGMLYVHRRMDEILQERSLVMWNANHLGMAYRVPTPKHGLTPQQARELTWDRRDWYRRRVDKIMKGYYTALRSIQVNASREMFPAMACDYFPSRDKFLRTYFAYMPKHQMDMVVVKPWNQREFNHGVLRCWRSRYYQCKGKK